jgi:hypothetical protein
MLLPAIALAALLFMPVAQVEARDEVDCNTPNSCEFASLCYSNGSCVKTGCADPNRQNCDGGSFGNCGSCMEM